MMSSASRPTSHAACMLSSTSRRSPPNAKWMVFASSSGHPMASATSRVCGGTSIPSTRRTSPAPVPSDPGPGARIEYVFKPLAMNVAVRWTGSPTVFHWRSTPGMMLCIVAIFGATRTGGSYISGSASLIALAAALKIAHASGHDTAAVSGSGRVVQRTPSSFVLRNRRRWHEPMTAASCRNDSPCRASSSSDTGWKKSANASTFSNNTTQCSGCSSAERITSRKFKNSADCGCSNPALDASCCAVEKPWHGLPPMTVVGPIQRISSAVSPRTSSTRNMFTNVSVPTRSACASSAQRTTSSTTSIALMSTSTQ